MSVKRWKMIRNLEAWGFARDALEELTRRVLEELVRMLKRRRRR